METTYTLSMLLSIISFAVATAFTPGPNNLMLLSSGLTFGYKHTLAHILGVTFGFPIMVLAVGFGMGSVLEHYPVLYQVLKVLSMLYLLWMAWQIANTKGNIHSQMHEKDKPFTFFQAILFQWVNPKAWVMVVTAIATFTNNSKDMMFQVIIIALVYVLVGLGSTHSWALGGVVLRRWLKNQKSISIFNKFMALLIVFSVLPYYV